MNFKKERFKRLKALLRRKKSTPLKKEPPLSGPMSGSGARWSFRETDNEEETKRKGADGGKKDVTRLPPPDDEVELNDIEIVPRDSARRSAGKRKEGELPAPRRKLGTLDDKLDIPDEQTAEEVANRRDEETRPTTSDVHGTTTEGETEGQQDAEGQRGAEDSLSCNKINKTAKDKISLLKGELTMSDSADDTEEQGGGGTSTGIGDGWTSAEEPAAVSGVLLPISTIHDKAPPLLRRFGRGKKDGGGRGKNSISRAASIRAFTRQGKDAEEESLAVPHRRWSRSDIGAESDEGRQRRKGRGQQRGSHTEEEEPGAVEWSDEGFLSGPPALRTTFVDRQSSGVGFSDSEEGGQTDPTGHIG